MQNCTGVKKYVYMVHYKGLVSHSHSISFLVHSISRIGSTSSPIELITFLTKREMQDIYFFNAIRQDDDISRFFLLRFNRGKKN